MRIVILPAIALFACAAWPAAAQLPGGISSLGGLSGAATSPGGIAGQQPQQNKSTEQSAPDAVPGARARTDSVVPLKGGTSDLAPTEALFDAINRGDILSARDAINRGADLDSTNLLGLTPIELSVDLGRNDISFLLLSLRGATGSAAASQQPLGAGGAGAAPSTAAERQAAAKLARANAVAQARLKANPREAAKTAQTPVLFAGNGGAPIPTAGFLGFDHR